MIINLQNKSNGGGSGQNVFKVQDKTVDITESGLTTIVPDEGYNGLSKVDVNVEAGGASFDWEGTGYTSEMGKTIDNELVNKHQADIDYTKQKAAEWDPMTTDASQLYCQDTNLFYGPVIDTSNVENMFMMYAENPNLIIVPRMDVSKTMECTSIFQNCTSLKEVHFTGGMKPECRTIWPFSGCRQTDLVFFYDLPGDYSMMLMNMPHNIKKQPLGDVKIQLRVYTNDAGQNAWATDSDHTISILGQNMVYTGVDALWEVTVNITKENYQTLSKDVTMDGVVIGQIEWNLEPQQIDVGQVPTTTFTITPQELYNAVDDKTNLAYDETLDIVKFVPNEDGTMYQGKTYIFDEAILQKISKCDTGYFYWGSLEPIKLISGYEYNNSYNDYFNQDFAEKIGMTSYRLEGKPYEGDIYSFKLLYELADAVQPETFPTFGYGKIEGKTSNYPPLPKLVKTRIYMNDKDQNSWVDGTHSVKLNGQPMNYTGKEAVWELLTLPSTEPGRVTVDDVEVGTVEYINDIQQIDVGQVPVVETEYTGQQVYEAIKNSTTGRDMIDQGEVDGNGNLIGYKSRMVLQVFPPTIKNVSAVEFDIDQSISLDWLEMYFNFNDNTWEGDKVPVTTGKNIYRAPESPVGTGDGFRIEGKYNGDDSLVRLTKIISETNQYPPYPGSPIVVPPIS